MKEKNPPDALSSLEKDCCAKLLLFKFTPTYWTVYITDLVLSLPPLPLCFGFVRFSSQLDYTPSSYLAFRVASRRSNPVCHIWGFYRGKLSKDACYIQIPLCSKEIHCKKENNAVFFKGQRKSAVMRLKNYSLSECNNMDIINCEIK
ncbi:hypothetical protein CEXT_707241 [Caerostris extrusa]|uniref:Uncharacterized protein n=1 Tax=Caerostris extrusa TaxID=172846 RepID=A0AAV4R4Z7_CAEEX|nr:hypothetical protein CEXT_707241 [Caerostris extrusa]